ncbi:hypothetical protein CANINC_003307 [Pichia inconspicua]|uniref:RING-type domain-containing protein n=1 Tax=Pichia inconspicua TaxID=52247 RepID=A0A4T0X0I0_9ASCO|nr:hypothetical protein CANINC_003307 [[Candida] inconspicua]
MTYLMYGNSNINGRTVRVKKLEVLTKEQLEDFFPFETYGNWLNKGKDEVTGRNKNKVGYRETFDSDSIIEIEPNDIEENESELKKGPDMVETDITDLEVKETFNSESIKFQTQRKHFTSGSCAICLEDLNNDDMVRGLLCGHVFHKVCIDPWLTHRKGYCPTCKKDLYIEVNKMCENREENETSEESVADIVVNVDYSITDLITLDDASSDSQDLDIVFNIHPDNLLSFFVITILTQVKAQTILIAMLYHRLNIGHIETNDNPLEEVITVNVSSLEKSVAKSTIKEIKHCFHQSNDAQSSESDTPPLPDLSNLNPLLKTIVEHRPSLFNAIDLHDIDYEAWKITQRMTKGVRFLFYKLMGISKTHLYYYNVVHLYNNRQYTRLHTRTP